MTKKQTKIITALSIIAFILALLVSGRYWLRLDLTKNKAYTISKVSRNLYKEIPDPVTITYYLSDRLRTIHPVLGEIEDTLREYAAYSRGKIRLVVRDPVKAGLTSIAEELGIHPFQIDSVEQDQVSRSVVYSGIVIEYVDKLDVLPFVGSTNTLEYDLTSRIRAMVSNTERQIGIIAGDSFRNWEEDYRYLNMTLSGAGYRVRQVSPGQEIPDNLPGLFVLGGVEDLDEMTLYRIDRFIQMGGKVFFAVKGIYIDTVYGSAEARYQQSLGLLEMIASYGVIIKPELVLDRNALFLQYQTRTQQGMMQRRIMRYPLWISVSRENGNPLHPVSSNFGGLDLYWASPLELMPPYNVDAQTLFTSTKEAWLQRENFYTSPEIPYMMELEASDTRGTKILGAALSGTFPSFFRDLEKPLADLPDIPQNARPSRIIVVGDVDFTSNLLSETEAVHNLDFLTRAADWLVNDDDIINIRNRQPQTGRLDKITDASAKIAAMRFSQILNIIIIPAFVIAAGLFLTSKRRREGLKYVV
ncbi:MAG: GldG family protein [Treponema sp.]|jgi:gliding-associated putative ABC transporter substrate-binding component GldG|nr:GldG family protein [Treponema sp.]